MTMIADETWGLRYMSKDNRSTIETIEILNDTMRRGLSEYEIEGLIALLRGTLIFPSIESGRGDGRRRYGRCLELEASAWGLPLAA